MRTFTSPRPARACTDKSKLGTQHSPSSAELRTRLAHHPRTQKKGGTTFRTRLRRQIQTWNAASPPQAPNSELVSPIIRAQKKGRNHVPHTLVPTNPNLERSIPPQAPNSELVSPIIRARKKGRNHVPRTRLRRQIQTWNAAFPLKRLNL